MSEYQRYAIYWSPEAGSDLARWGARWLGWCADQGEPWPHAQIDGLPRPVEDLTAAPRHYGFHATLKAPFRLAEEQSQWGLEQALEEFGADTAPFKLPPLAVTVVDGFVALCPVKPSPALARLAADCVCGFDMFRAPASPEDLAKRRQAGLTPAQENNLLSWGYPYVLGDFQFHITLTGRLEPDEASAVAEVLSRELAPLLKAPIPVREVALYGDPGDGMLFRLLQRYPLTGESDAMKAAALSASGPSLLSVTTSGPTGSA